VAVRVKLFLVILLLATLLLPGCAVEEQGSGGEPTNETVIPSGELANGIMIPSSLQSWEVFAGFVNTTPPLGVFPYMFGEWSPKNMDPYAMPKGASEEGFLQGFGGEFPEMLYTKRGETPKVTPNMSDWEAWLSTDSNTSEAANMTFWLVLSFLVLKYENTEFAERSFNSISAVQELQGSTYNGLALKSGIHSLDYWEDDMWEESTALCYLIHSGCFVIYFYGRDDVARDALDRLIEAFGVKSSSNQTQAGNTS